MGAEDIISVYATPVIALALMDPVLPTEGAKAGLLPGSAPPVPVKKARSPACPGTILAECLEMEE